MRTPGFVSEPQVPYLSRVLEEITSGVLRFPRFQRKHVWTPDQRLELLRSVRDGIPIGSILVWRTTTVVTTAERIGPRALPTADMSPTIGAYQYILDGVQRLSTLLIALVAGSREVDEDPDWVTLFDLDDNDFVLAKDRRDLGLYVPTTVLVDSLALLHFQRDLAARPGVSAGDLRQMVDTVDGLARSFRDYKLPVIPIASDDLEMATRTFQRINSQGTRMERVHMVHALTWSEEFSLLDRIDAATEESLPAAWAEGLDEDLVLKTVSSAVNLDVYEANVDTLSEKLKERPTVVNEAVQNLAVAVKILRERCIVASPGLLPYSLQLVLIADAIRVAGRGLAVDQEELLENWFWATCWGELFAGISGRRLGVVRELLREDVRSRRLRWSGPRPFARRPLPPRVDTKSARSKGLALWLARRGPLLDDGAQFDVADWLERAGARCLVTLLPRQGLPPESFASPGNRVVYPSERVSHLKEQLLRGQLDDDVLASHEIPQEAAEAAIRGCLEDFVRLRAIHLNEIETRNASQLGI